MWDKTTHLFGFIALSYTLRPLYANFPHGYFFFLELRLPVGSELSMVGDYDDVTQRLQVLKGQGGAQNDARAA